MLSGGTLELMYNFLDNHKQKGREREKKAAAPPQNATGLVCSMALQCWWKVTKEKEEQSEQNIF